MDSISILIYQIDIENEQINPVNKNSYGQDFDKYLGELIGIISTGSGREFQFERETTEVRGLFPKLLDSTNFPEISETVAKRLLSIEKTAQKKIEKLEVKIQKGIVVQAIVRENDCFKYVICKADHSEFLRDEDYQLTKGLPVKKKVFKAFVATFTESIEITNVLVYDTNSVMASYWWKDFLELTEVYTDKHNTITAFYAIDKGVFTKMKKESPQDYVYLRNSVVRYFRANQTFDMNDFIQTAIGDYKPYDPKLKVDTLKDSIRSLPKQRKFDEKFTILKEEVKAKFVNKISLTAQIELHLKEDIDKIEKVITTEVGKAGERYVKILSDSGYNYFNNLNNKQ